MASPGTESTPRERLARVVTLLGRTWMFRRGAAAIAIVGIAISLGAALRSKRIYRSETTVLYRDGLQRGAGEAEPAAQRAARLGPKLKDLLYARPNLEEVIREHGLFPEKTSRSMLDGIDEMMTATSFRARASDSYVISFSYEDPAIAQHVAARLAERMIDAYDRQNLDTATLARNFLRKKLDEATASVDDASRALAMFLAEHPQFQWGGADSPYAPAPAGAPLAHAPARPPATTDPVLRALERDLARVESELAPGGHATAAIAMPEAQRQRDAAATALAVAESALAEKLMSVTPAHPDAVSAAARVSAGRQALAAAESALARARAGAIAEAPSARAAPTPERQRALEKERMALRRQMEARRGGGALPASPAAPRAVGSGDVVELETEWHRLRLTLDRARSELGTIQQNARAAELAADAAAKQGREEMQILEPAYLPARPDRGRGRVFFAGATIALFLAFAYAASRVLLDDTLLDEGDVAAIGAPTVLVSMPHMTAPEARETTRTIVPVARWSEHGATEPAVITPPPCERTQELSGSSALALVREARIEPALVEVVCGDPEVEILGADLDPAGATRIMEGAPREVMAALRVLRHRLEQRRGDGSFVVSVMSPGRAEGKTSLALRLAITLAEADRARVVLVEGHLERPRLAAELGLRLAPEVSFSAQIQQRMSGHSIPWGVVRLTPSLSLLAEADAGACHPEAIHSTHFEAAIDALRRRHEYVIIDGPQIVGSGDANVLEGVSDGALLVVRARSTRGTALTRATQQLGSPRVIGVVLNDVV